MNKCVYLHLDLNDIPFYVGKGNLDRSYSRSGRNKNWKNIAVNGYSVKIIDSGLTEQLSSELEEFLFEFIPNLVNIKRKSDERHDYSLVDWNNIVYYDETSPTCLRYLNDNKCRNPNFRKFKNEPAGCLRFGKLHGQIVVKGKSYAIHRVIWFLHNKSVNSNKVINHINNNPMDNRISNLELCSTSENNNRKITRNTLKSNVTSTGHVNISTRYFKGKLKMFCGIRIYGVKYSKQLDVDSLGYDFCLNELINFRNSKLKIITEEN